MSEWISIKDRLPDAVRIRVVVYAPKGLYECDCGMPSYHVLFWYKCGFSEDLESHSEIMKKTTHWLPLPDFPKEMDDE